MYELTHHEDKYDLRYRLRDKFNIPAIAPEVPPVSRSPATKHASGDTKTEAKHSDSQSRGQGNSSRSAAGGGKDALVGGGGGGGGGGFLLVTSSNVVLCEGRLLQLFDFSGEKVRAVYMTKLGSHEI